MSYVFAVRSSKLFVCAAITLLGVVSVLGQAPTSSASSSAPTTTTTTTTASTTTTSTAPPTTTPTTVAPPIDAVDALSKLPPAAAPTQPCDRTRRVYTDSWGEISDGPPGYNYTQDSHCEWLIKAKNESQFITLTFRSMATECSYDYIFVYDGDSFGSTLLGSFSGKTEPQRIVASSGSMLILLYSDTNYVLNGFRAEFSVSNCANNCTNQGKCVGHKCVCQGEWIGHDCSEDACPQSCGAVQGHGTCSRDRCDCNAGWTGKACSLNAANPIGNAWHTLANVNDGMVARTAHTAVYINKTDSLYIFGGFNLNSILSSLQIYRFNKSDWENELGLPLKSFTYPHHYDPDLLMAVLQDPGDPTAWGLKRDVSIFRNILTAITGRSPLNLRKQRSPHNINGTTSSSNMLEDYVQVIDADSNSRTPDARYGHAAVALSDGFVIYGGKVTFNDLSNELWLYNVSDEKGIWTQRATNSTFEPPPLTRHTLTLANDGWLYLFGGSLENGEFSSRIFRIRLANNPAEEQWHEIFPRGGKSLDVRVVAHTTIFDKTTNSLIVYGGVIAGVARFSKLSDRLFAFQLDERHWTEILYPRPPSREAFIPRERAFHTATKIGNYMVVFGGYSHRHNKEEICYDNQMYLYHLGCHTWISQDVLGKSKVSSYPKQQGVFGHAVTLRNKNTLLIVGGYHGNVNADLLAYTLPPILVVNDEQLFDPEAVCHKHHNVSECLSDPECGWCSADNICYGRTVGANCTTNLQTTRCPGICPALSDCHACLIHGLSARKTQRAHSVANKLGLNQCNWCVQNGKCHHKDDNYGGCGEDTPSQSPGWWGIKGTEVAYAKQCTELDHRPGLTFLKYYHPVDWQYPDDIQIINATSVDFLIPPSTTHTEQTHNGEMVARLLGYVRPFKTKWKEQVNACASYSHAILRMGVSPETMTTAANMTVDELRCILTAWPSLDEKFLVDFRANRTLSIDTGSHHQPSRMRLEHNTIHESSRKPFTYEFLEPYSNGTCDMYTNCQHCLSDSLCGWCELTMECVSRLTDESDSCSVNDEFHYLTLQPQQCANCSNYISCEQCMISGNCEWWADDARCSRIGRSPSAVRNATLCPAPCYQRANCSACLDEIGRCVWCEATQQCFTFAVYTSEYQFGLCREWFDQVPNVGQSSTNSTAHGVAPKQQCKSCNSHGNCSSCLQSLSCGWCFDRDNPIEGVCMHGDFNRSTHDCSRALKSDPEDAEWAYAQCPDVDECGLGLHDCHKEAKCTNTHGSYYCHCRRGFVGDGRASCVRTCFESCVNGYCSGPPDYACKCNLGWTGSDCSKNCGCNNHSTCAQGIGSCDNCEDWTEGTFCERCRPGSHGNATDWEIGCKPCECNGHGNEGLGICDVQTGECYCQDNTEGLKCEMCNREFYGDPRDRGQCYFQCESRGMLTSIGRQGIGSRQSHRAPWGGPEARECLWIISPHTTGDVPLNDSLIMLDIDKDDLNVTCDKNAVYVYDGLPDLTGNTIQSQLLAVFCSEDVTPLTVEARSGHLTVHYKQSRNGQGFNAMYHVRSCSSGTCLPPYVCEQGKCMCPDGYSGARCETAVCAANCTAHLKQGNCDRMYGRCICAAGFGGLDCSVKIRETSVVFTELFNSQLLKENLEHLRKTLPRFGHTLVADKRGSLWMFGGYSLSHGPLNDIRQFDTKNNTWMQVTVDSTPDAKMPEGRYFHASEIVSARQSIYVYGGLTSVGKELANHFLGDLWHFSVQNQRWEEEQVEGDLPPPLAGHSLTLIRRDDYETLLLIGGFSSKHGLLKDAWEYMFSEKEWNKLVVTGAGPVGIFGHSTVFSQHNQVAYVFGGYHYKGNKAVISNTLYALDFATMTWSELPSFHGNNIPEDNLPRARFLHSAVSTLNYMLVFGGTTHPHNASDVLLAYVYKCNQWIRLTVDVQIVGKLPISTHAQAMTIDPESDSIYIVGGWDGSLQTRVTRIDLPEDLCVLWSGSKYLCREVTGCSFCAVKPREEFGSHCYSNDRSDVCGNYTGALVYTNADSCDNALISKRNCTTFDQCESCLAKWPGTTSDTNVCRWRSKSNFAGGSCSRSTGCDPTYEECSEDGVTIANREECPSVICGASDCEKCRKMEGCKWIQSDILYGCYLDDYVDAFIDRNCVDERTRCEPPDLLERLNTKKASCPRKCSDYRNCSTCLMAASNSDEDDEYNKCFWSTQLNECISPTYLPLYCVGGVCGLVLTPEDKASHCPEPCSSYSQCATCLRHAHCGWCSKSGFEGDGVCTEGSLESPTEHPLASTCDIIYASRKNMTTVDPSNEFHWNYIQCPPENECVNHHHNCDAKSERCVDLPEGYECKCGDGYKSSNIEGECIPVCTQGCVRGTCINPNVCLCDFGYVGANCSIQCQCNGHSNCRGPDKLDECIQCHNNTIGDQCDKCRPLFVGDPKNSGECVPCTTYCNGHAEVCVGRDAEPPVNIMTRPELEEFLKEGALTDAICLRCANQTDGDRCEGCVYGHFRGTESFNDACRPCECHGHGDTCDPVTGEKCNCGNNTESDATCSASSSKNSAQQCWSVQCSKCRDSYAGNPIDGHQCYKQITVESKMCFDAKTIDECKIKPSPLKPGQTVFFVIQPRFMNVDIRIIVDVTQGELDLFMSPQDDSFVIMTNKSNGNHNILLDDRYHWDMNENLIQPLLITHPKNKDNAEAEKFGPQLHDCRYDAGTGFHVKDKYAEKLSTHITLYQCNTLLRVFGLKNRLVLTLPQTTHNLSTTRFYMALRAHPISAASYGLVFFRQDQLHIDLFVFFSVFFSCFFLFLAVCVVAWKAKQAADVRRARRRHVVEMQHMAKRPFARFTIFCGFGSDSPVQNRRRGRSKSQPNNLQQDIRPVAVEPTVDGIAAVTTVFVRLPGKFRAPVNLALGSTLTVCSRQYPNNGGRALMRRRGSHHAPQQPQQPQAQAAAAGQ